MKILYFIALILLVMTQQLEAKKHLLYVGTYTKGMTDGIFIYSFNDKTGKLKDLKIPVVSNNPSFLTISPNNKYLYAVGETDDPDKNHSGGVSAFKIEKKGRLKLINHVLTEGPNPCHVSISSDGKKLIASNYTGGSISLFNLLPDGSLTEMIQKVQHEGSGPYPGRQEGPHAHSAKFSPDGRLLFAADLGIDELKIYEIKLAVLPLSPHSQPFVKFSPGSGPRHFDFTPDLTYIYVINELSSTVSVLMKYGNTWKEVQSISTLPKDFEGENTCADIHLSANGNFVYASNRGHNSLVVYQRDKTNGKLELIQTTSVQGDWPRNFTIDPKGRFLLVANQRSNDIVVFSIDEATGKLLPTGKKIECNSPVCLQFLK
jgi:6-phosphogluconolactonase